jgi:hypothetical protein
MNAFHVIGGLTAIWAVIVAVIGIRNADFPGGAERIVGAISLLLVVGAISAAILTSEDEGGEEHGGGEAATSESH